MSGTIEFGPPRVNLAEVKEYAATHRIALAEVMLHVQTRLELLSQLAQDAEEFPTPEAFVGHVHVWHRQVSNQFLAMLTPEAQ